MIAPIFVAALSIARAGDPPAIELTATVSPVASSAYGLHLEDKALGKLLDFAPAARTASHAAREFEPFLPKADARPGDTWMVQKTAVLPFLRQIHAGAKTDLHFGWVGGPGTFACLLARDATMIDVLFRAHAEFDLANGTTLLTPAQFEGRLIWSVQERAPLAFRFAVPDRDTNYDLNAPQGDSGMSLADIGYRPTMELASARAPDPIDPARLEDARGRLRKAFYPSARLEWLPFATAVARATAEQKPIHLLILFGTFDDESC